MYGRGISKSKWESFSKAPVYPLQKNQKKKIEKSDTWLAFMQIKKTVLDYRILLHHEVGQNVTLQSKLN